MNSHIQWFTEARFGLFVHFGAYSALGRDAWIRSRERMSITDYQPTVDAFHPEHFDPEAWAEAAANAGMRYAVMTAKHHDGFCLFDSALTDYTVMHNGFGRDMVAEFLYAFRKRGIKVGLYYSLLDWHHPDYPSHSDENHPHRGEARSSDRHPDFDRYLDYFHGQVEELLTGYGHLDVLWFDFSYADLVGEAWRAEELVAMVRRLQPHIGLNNRLDAGAGGLGTLVTGNPAPWAGDWACPESLVPDRAITDPKGDPVPWEACMPHNNHWGWFDGDEAFKPSSLIVRKLVEIVSKGGNLLLNVGPQPDGRFPEASLSMLRDVGAWLEANGESVYGATSASAPAKPDWGWYTRRGNTLYAHVLEPVIGPLALTGVPGEDIRSLHLLATGEPLERMRTWLSAAYPDKVLVGLGDEHTHTCPLPDGVDTVIAIELDPASALLHGAHGA